MKNLSCCWDSSNFRNLFPVRIYLERIIISRYLRPWNFRTLCDSDVIISSITNTFMGPLNESFQTSLRMEQYKRYRTISCVNTAQIWLKLLCLVPNGGVKFVSVTLEFRRSRWFCKFRQLKAVPTDISTCECVAFRIECCFQKTTNLINFISGRPN